MNIVCGVRDVCVLGQRPSAPSVERARGGAMRASPRDDRSDEDRRGAEPGAQGAHRRAHAHQGETRETKAARKDRMNE